MRSHRVLVAAGMLLGACGHGGGGSDPGPTPTPVTVTLNSVFAQEGSLNASGSNYIGGPVCGENQGFPGPGPFRAFVTFALALPAGATVTGAVLHLRQLNVSGAPYAHLGQVVAEHLDYGAGAPSATHWAQAPLDGTGGVLSADATLADRALDVTASVQADRAAARPRTQFRLRFSPLDADADGVPDMVNFETGDDWNHTGEVPRLVVTYTP